MKREILNVEGLRHIATGFGVEFCDGRVAIGTPLGSKGSGLLMTQDVDEDGAVLVKVPADLVLSAETVWIYAKADKHLTEVLQAMGDFAKTAKGAIRLFLLLQLTNGATDGEIGVSTFFTTFVKHLPKHFSMPTFWDENEIHLLDGTSLEAATKDKLKNLDQEFTVLQERTSKIDWCQKYWWNSESGSLSFHDWKVVDAMYRSRAMDLPGTGFATVPIIDMANHASGLYAYARYETDAEGNAILTMRDTVKLRAGEEITITYGDDKGASEMLHSYGFIEPRMSSAKEMFLSLEIPDDDELKFAKKVANISAPGVKMYQKVHQHPLDRHMGGMGETEHKTPINWESPYLWLIVVNEEDGLELEALQSTDGGLEVQVSWKGQLISHEAQLENLLAKEPLWPIFKLRAIKMLHDRLMDQIMHFERSKTQMLDIMEAIGSQTNANYVNAMKLRDLESTMMWAAYEELGVQMEQLAGLEDVQEYLQAANVGMEEAYEEDFA